MIRRIVPFVCALLASAAIVEGCTPISVYQGFQVVDAKPADLKVGEDTRSTVLARLGSPSSVSTFDPNVWFYITQVSEHQAFYQSRTIRRDVVAVSFDKADDKVAKIDTLSLKDGRVIAFNGRETPTRGRSLSVLEQIIGTLGQGGLLNNPQDVAPGTRPGEGGGGPR
ncbi:MAG TPA: outer membrane protein assembly factor BamE [Caulobacteraceae bacterium]|jgi:outer membrane protein assembly factor BamE (lipoprotein component of BamABCDE complex)|nr:outer membrane protein assembly factor BamE [Caulobacteraceae bacterium]